MEPYSFTIGGSMREVLSLLESLPPEEKVHGYPIMDAIMRLRASIQRCEAIQQEQLIHIGQGENHRYRA